MDSAWGEADQGMESAWNEAGQTPQMRNLSSAQNIKSTLELTNDPKMINSKFYAFITGISEGQLEINEDEKVLMKKDEITGTLEEADELDYEIAWEEAGQEIDMEYDRPHTLLNTA